MVVTAAGNQKEGPLTGLRILDMSRILAGPFATQLLGDMGADVIKVERPTMGDDTRRWGPPFVTDGHGQPTNESAYYLSANRNKRSIAVDMACPQGAEVLRNLALTCDVVIHNFKPGGLIKYGLDADRLCAADPKLVYCEISGFGQTGPNSQRPGYDLLAQACGGIMSLTGDPQGPPMKIGVGIADVMCGMYASNAILAAIRHRDRTGEGQKIDISLVDSQIAWLVNAGVDYLISGNTPVRRGNQHPNIVPYQVFEVADGHLIIAAGNDRQFERLCTLLERSDLSADVRFASNAARLHHRELLIETLEAEVRQWSKNDLLTAMEAASVPGGPISTLPEVFDSDQVAAREMKISMPHALAEGGRVDLIGNPIKFSKSPVSYRRGPPLCGEHTDEVLAEMGSATGGREKLKPETL